MFLRMLVIDQFRLFFSVGTLVLSIPFAWRSHVNKKIDAGVQGESTMIQGNNVEDFEQIVVANDESTAGSIISTDGTENASYGDRFTKVVEDLDKQLGINFGTENRLRLIKATEGQEEQGKRRDKATRQRGKSRNKVTGGQEGQIEFQSAVSWIKERVRLLGSIVGFEIFSGHVRSSNHQISLMLLNLIGVLVCFYFNPVIKSCLSYVVRKLLAPFPYCILLLRYLAKQFTRLVSRKDKSQKKERKRVATRGSLGPQSLTNIKDPESVSPSRASVDEQSESNFEDDQPAVCDEKKNWIGLEQRKDTEPTEWLEGSYIEGGIQTYTQLENENNRQANRTGDYLQTSGENSRNAGHQEHITPRTSTPVQPIVFKQKRNSSLLNDSKIYTPVKLQRFLFERYNETQDVGIGIDESELDLTRVAVAAEQKRGSMNYYDTESKTTNLSGLDDFVSATKIKIRSRLMNMSYV